MDQLELVDCNWLIPVRGCVKPFFLFLKGKSAWQNVSIDTSIVSQGSGSAIYRIVPGAVPVTAGFIQNKHYNITRTSLIWHKVTLTALCIKQERRQRENISRNQLSADVNNFFHSFTFSIGQWKLWLFFFSFKCVAKFNVYCVLLFLFRYLWLSAFIH